MKKLLFLLPLLALPFLVKSHARALACSLSVVPMTTNGLLQLTCNNNGVITFWDGVHALPVPSGSVVSIVGDDTVCQMSSFGVNFWYICTPTNAPTGTVIYVPYGYKGESWGVFWNCSDDPMGCVFTLTNLNLRQCTGGGQ